MEVMSGVAELQIDVIVKPSRAMGSIFPMFKKLSRRWLANNRCRK